jgi:hypothetical protein
VTALPVDLTPYRNATVATFDGERIQGAVNAWGNSFPAEELPFGGILTVGGTLFRLPAKAPGEPDSVEPLGQAFTVAEPALCLGIALLACGEMGDQRVALRVLDPAGEEVAACVAVARGVMIPAGKDPGTDCIASSHLHYPGDYDLALALPALWHSEHRWDRALPVARIELGINPLFHLLGLTLLVPLSLEAAP